MKRRECQEPIVPRPRFGAAAQFIGRRSRSEANRTPVSELSYSVPARVPHRMPDGWVEAHSVVHMLVV
jgi:hypothetical protein